MIAAVLCILLTIVLFERNKETFLLKDHFYYALFIKLGAGMALGCLYHFHYKSGDTLNYFQDAGRALDVLVLDVASGVRFLFFGEDKSLGLIYENQPRALFFVRLITPLLLITGKSYWGLTIIISLLSFITTWILANKITARYGVSILVVSIAMFYVPEVVFWSSGILKESLSLLFQFVLLILVLNFIEKKRIVYVLLFVLVSSLLYKLKFYVAAVYIPVLISFVITQLISIKKEVVFIGSFVFLLLVATMIHPHLSFSTLLNQLYLNMERTIAISDEGKTLVLPFDGSFVSLFQSLPIGISSLVRPFIWEAKGSLLVGLSVLKFDLLIGIVLALLWVKKVTYEAKLILFYSSIMMVLLTIASPNFGTLSRYSISFLPFLMIVILVPIISFFEKEKV